jgi:hypothetical protein
MPDRPPLPVLLDNAARSRRYLGELMDRSWPGGTADRMQPAALEWLRRWQPRRAAVTPPDGASFN